MQQNLLTITYPEDCPYLDEVNVRCRKNTLITCSPYFAKCPKGCFMMENAE